MLTLEQAIRRSAAVTLGLLAAAGTAAAQGTPGTGDTPTTGDPMQPDPMQPQPMQQDPVIVDPDLDEPVIETTDPVDVDVNVTTPPPPPPPQPTYTAPSYTVSDPDMDIDRDTTLERYGIAVALGGGVEGFTNETLRDTTDDGGQWNVRVALGTRSPIGFEGAYIGSAQAIDALGLDDDALLVGNGLEGKLRINLLDSNIQPFAIAGVAWRHYELTNSDFNTSDVAEDDDVLEIPVGVGVAWKYRGFLLDARGEVRYAQYADMVPSLDNEADAGNMHRWGVNANIGYAF